MLNDLARSREPGERPNYFGHRRFPAHTHEAARALLSAVQTSERYIVFLVVGAGVCCRACGAKGWSSEKQSVQSCSRISCCRSGDLGLSCRDIFSYFLLSSRRHHHLYGQFFLIWKRQDYKGTWTDVKHASGFSGNGVHKTIESH